MSNSKTMQSSNEREWAPTVDKAKETAASVGELASDAATAVGAMASKAASDVGKKADSLTASAGAGIQQWGDRLSKNAPHEGVLGSASQAVAQAVKDGGEHLRDTKPSGITEVISKLVRKNPIPAVLIAIGLGWFASSKLRG